MNIATLLAAGLFCAGPGETQIDEKFLADARAPTASKTVLRYAKSELGKKVGDGECSTLAVEALRAAKTAPRFKDGEAIWGELVLEIKPGVKKTTKILPGDILQFEDVRLEGKIPGGGAYFQSAPHHTAIVSKVGPAGVYVLHQNWGPRDAERPVVGSLFRLGDLRQGTIAVYRPK